MATYYCSGQNGNDSNNGTTVALARKTLDSALSLLSGGDTLYIGPATYREILTDPDFPAGSGEGSETQIIGDPDSNILTGDIPGPVRITTKDVNEKSVQASYVLTCGTNHLHFHKIYFEGGGAIGLSTSGNASTAYNRNLYLYTSSDISNMIFFDCYIIGGYFGCQAYSYANLADKCPTFVRCLFLNSGLWTSNCNTINCIGIGARTGFQYGNHHGTIALGGFYGFYRCASPDNTGFGYLDGAHSTDYNSNVNNCISVGQYYNYRDCAGMNNVALSSALYAWYVSSDEEVDGLWIGNSFRGASNLDTQNHQNLYYSQNYQNDYSSDGAVFNNGGGIIFSPNMWLDIFKAFKPYDGFTIDGTNNVTAHGMQGWFSASNDDFNPTTGSANGLNQTTLQGLLTGSFDVMGNPYNLIKTVGPYNFVSSSLNFSTTSGSNPSIEIGGFGSKIFNIPVSASSNFTASVAVKYNSGTAPRLEITSSGIQFGTSGKSGSIIPQVVSATGTGNQTSTFQTLKVSSSVNMNDNVQLKLVQPHDDNSSFAIFAQLQVEGE